MAITRIYGKIVNTWTRTVLDLWGREKEEPAQYEMTYTDYNEDGTVYQTGTEDFSPERYRKVIVDKWVHTWDGQKVNKGGKRWFDCRGSIQYRRGDGKAVKALMQIRYPQAAAIELR